MQMKPLHIGLLPLYIKLYDDVDPALRTLQMPFLSDAAKALEAEGLTVTVTDVCRVKEEFERNSCITWVTNGRTIENYIPENLFNVAVSNVHPKTYKKIKWSRFGDLTRLRKDKVVDKVAVARFITNTSADFSMLDLGASIDRLVADISKSNSV